MIRLAIVEDEENYIEQLQNYLHRYEGENGCRFAIRVFRDGDEILNKYEGDLDIILMDIQMPFTDGMTAAEQIREMDPEVVMMFITNMEQYAIRGYQVNALDYMVKPVEYFSFSRKLDRAIARLRYREQHYIVLHIPGGVQKIRIGELYYVESQGHDLHYHAASGEYVIRGVMRDTETMLERHGFFRCNKGCLVNLAGIEAVRDGCAVIGGDRIPISRGRRKEFMEALADHMSDTLT